MFAYTFKKSRPMNTKRNIYKTAEHPFAQYVRILGKGKTGSRSLSYEEAYQAFSMILKDEVLDVQLGAFLMLLRVKEESVDELGYSNQKINSGAGHDAQFAAYMLPTTMVFVPSKDGHSHCEPEYTSPEQCTQGASVLLNAVLKCDAK